MLASEITHHLLLTIQSLVEGLGLSHVNQVGALHPTLDRESWVVVYPLGWDQSPARAATALMSFQFQLSVHSRLAEATGNTNTVFKLAAQYEDALRNRAFDVTTPDGTILGGARISEGDHRYMPYRNLTFAGEGNFAVENSNTHTVVITYTVHFKTGG